MVVIAETTAHIQSANRGGGSLAVGSRVEARFARQSEWYHGRVERVRADGSYDIHYDDGDPSVTTAAALLAQTAQTAAAAAAPSAPSIVTIGAAGASLDLHDALRRFYSILLLLLALAIVFRVRLRRAWRGVLEGAAKKGHSTALIGSPPPALRPLSLDKASPKLPPTPQSSRVINITGRSPTLKASPAGPRPGHFLAGSSPASAAAAAVRGVPPALDIGAPADRPTDEDKHAKAAREHGSLLQRAKGVASSVVSSVGSVVGSAAGGAAKHNHALTHKTSLPPPAKRKGSNEGMGMGVGGGSGAAAPGAFAPRCLNGHSVLTGAERAQLCGELPFALRSRHWTMMYNSAVHGHHLHTLYHMTAEHADARGASLLIVADSDGAKLAVFLGSERWRRSSRQYYGSGDMFVAAVAPRFAAYPWTGRNSYFVVGGDDSLVVGGGGEGYALWLDQGFETGTTCRSATFDNEPLASAPRFSPVAVECWGFTMEQFGAAASPANAGGEGWKQRKSVS
eukprot:g3689.t1